MKLRDKGLLFFIPLSLAACGAILFLTKFSLHRIIRAELANRVLLRTPFIDAATRESFATGDERRLLPFLQALAERVAGAYAIALGTGGEVLAHTNVVEKGKRYTDPATFEAISAPEPGYREITQEHKPVLDIYLPVWQESAEAESERLLLGSRGEPRKRLGTIRIGLPLDAAIDTQNQILLKFSGILAGTVAVAVVLSIFFLRRLVLEPIAEITSGTRAVQRGEYGLSLKVRTRDEIGQLASSFNQMSRELMIRTDELAAQRAELARSNEELEQFAHLASHDLQEPLRMVSSYLQLLALEYQDKLGPEADEFIRYALDGSKRMKDLIDSLLSYSRVGSRGKPFELVNVNEALESALLNLKVALEESQAKVSSDPMPTVPGDRIQVIELFQNLVNNAIKFRGEKKPEVHVSAKPENGHWIFSVSDNGIGIEEKQFKRIFEIFQRLHPREKYPGTGIGLAVCKKIVERHGGNIWVESKVGEGSAFKFTLGEEKKA